VVSFSYWSIKLWFHNRGKTCRCAHHTFLLGFPTGLLAPPSVLGRITKPSTMHSLAKKGMYIHSNTMSRIVTPLSSPEGSWINCAVLTMVWSIVAASVDTLASMSWLLNVTWYCVVLDAHCVLTDPTLLHILMYGCVHHIKQACSSSANKQTE
jgi:hypothetical protein